MVHWAEGLSPREFKEQLRWFARDVMPAFRRLTPIPLRGISRLGDDPLGVGFFVFSPSYIW